MKLRVVPVLLLTLALLVLLIGINMGLPMDQSTRVNQVGRYITYMENLNEKYDDLIVLMSAYQGEYVESNSKELKLFSALFDIKLISVDLRNPSMVVFCFDSTHPESTIELIYCLDDQIKLQSDTWLMQDTDEMRIEHLGVTKTGYIFCKRVRECWFYFESFLPT